MFEITEGTYLGELVDKNPMASKVLLKYGLDFCCGGQRSLSKACKDSDVDIDQILQELKVNQCISVNQLWANASNDDLIAHILDHYHASLYENLPHLEELLKRVIQNHLDKDTERLTALKNEFSSFSEELLDHMAKEEQVLFPWILNNQGPSPVGPIQCMRIDHDRAGHSLELIYTLTEGYKAPDQACITWRNLFAGLEKLDNELRMHIHLENNILFPRFMEEELTPNHPINLKAT
jgi:regulator of cell morphogenesis and NO signaling|tara:strand:+ start:347 stop:1054 length:708 start_codon:yes stop_codon:yes gene_type:complete